MTATAPATDLGYQTIVQAFTPRLADISPYEPTFGLLLQCQYLFGGLRGASGAQYVLERKFVGPLTGGLWFMATRDGGLQLHPQCLNTCRGEVRRTFTDGRRQWSDVLFNKVPAELVPPGLLAMEFELTDTTLAYSEGELINLTGTTTGAALSYYAIHREHPLYYVSMPFRVDGVIDGDPVSGGIFIDHAYWPHGREWKEYRFYEHTQLSWMAYINDYTDGTVEAGHLLKGTAGFAVCAVADGTDLIAGTGRLDARFSLDDNQYLAGAEFAADDHTWRFTTDKEGHMVDFGKARWGGYRAQCGTVQRVGDTRELRNGWAWLDYFTDRIAAAGLVLPPAGGADVR